MLRFSVSRPWGCCLSTSSTHRTDIAGAPRQGPHPGLLRGKAPRKPGRTVKSQATAMTQKVEHRKEADKPQPDDVTLARKVESEIFRDADVPKGQINVNAENGKIVLRGEVERAGLIQDLEERTRKVQGVQEVENLLHTPGTPRRRRAS